MKREFLQLADTYDAKKHGVAGWFLSEKLDGMRALWDGGVSRGKPCREVPWANTEKHARFVVQPTATGLWTRYGQPIHAPDWFLNQLPPCILDGELYAGRGMFQHVISVTKKHQPIDSEWKDIRYNAFDSPNPFVVFAPGTINNTNFKKTIPVVDKYMFSGMAGTGVGDTFQSRLKFLYKVHSNWSGNTWHVHDQEQLPFKTADAVEQMEQWLKNIVEAGGEGVILKSPSNLWLPERCHDMLKHKAWHDAEGTVTGYTWGRETDKGSKLLGMMGALILMQDNGKRLEISGFTDAERQMAWYAPAGVEASVQAYGSLHPGKECADHVHNPKFPRGTRITYQYRELTNDGVAKEARYWRQA